MKTSDNRRSWNCLTRLWFCLFLWAAGAGIIQAAEAEWKAGFASVKITPEKPVRLSGYASRIKPFERVESDLFAKVLVLEDKTGRQSVLLTCDLIGLPAAIVEEVSRAAKEKHGLERRRIIFSASHTHSGPALNLNVTPTPGGSIEDAENTAVYTRGLIEKLSNVIGDALARLEPVELSWGGGVAHFAMNRREFTPRGVILGVNPGGLADRTVPVLKISSLDGAPRAAVFSYACHNTTLTGGNYEVCGDYSGFAQAYVEQQFPSIQAMFMSGCGGDANPYPRGTMDLARRHGAELGAEVCRLLESDLQPVSGPLTIAFDHARLPLQKFTRQELREMADHGTGLQRGGARNLLAKLDRGETLLEHYPAPVAVWQFGASLTLVALPSEVVVDYVPLLQKALGPLQLWITAYCNDYFGYIPSPKTLAEGGYETRGLFSGEGWFTPETADVLVNTTRDLALEAGRVISDR